MEIFPPLLFKVKSLLKLIVPVVNVIGATVAVTVMGLRAVKLKLDPAV